MSYGNQYNTRRQSSGRYNTPGQFVPAASTPTPSGVAPTPAPALSNMRLTTQINNLHTIQTTDIEMKPEPPSTPAPQPMATGNNSSGTGGNKDEATRPAWMKPRLAGVKKISNKERRRRQNANLRRILTPKNALMVLNELMPGEQLTNQYNVEACSPYNAPNLYGKPAAFAAELSLQGRTYQGYGDSKMSARNAAAEQAIRDLVLRRMAGEKDAMPQDGSNGASNEGEDDGTEGDASEDSQLPMMQLASFALHKLFSEWEFDGHKVPQLKPPKISESSSVGSEASAGTPRAPRAPKQPKPPKALPANASTMHPSMLLAYMRPLAQYRDMDQEGELPNLTFTVGVDVDDNTYCGKGQNKKEARRAAARTACQELFGVQFEETAQDTKPIPIPALV